MRQAMLSFLMALSRVRDEEAAVVPAEGKTRCGVWQEKEQLRPWHGYGREGSPALGQVQISVRPNEPRAERERMG